MASILQQNVPEHIPFARDIFALTKPKITVMALLVALGGLLHAPYQGAFASCMALLGIAFLVSGSSALNMYLERELDKRMLRTSDRPLPAGRISPQWAVLTGILCAFGASMLLWWSANGLTLALGALSLVLYVWCYTPLKQYSWISLLVGSIPGAMPVVLGYIAAANMIDAKAIALFSWAFLWQIPHFLAISLFREQEYSNAGFPVLSRFIGREKTKWVILFSSWLLVFSTLPLYFTKVLTSSLAVCAVLVGAWFLYECHRGCFSLESNLWAKRAFKASLVYQSLLFLLIIVAAL